MRLRRTLLTGLLLLLPAASGLAQPPLKETGVNNPGPSAVGDWTVYPGAYNSQRHSPLKQVTPARITAEWWTRWPRC